MPPPSYSPGCEPLPRGYTADAYLLCALREDTVLKDRATSALTEFEFETFKNTQMFCDMQMRREDIKNRRKSLDAMTGELESLRVEANTAPRVTRLQEVVEVPKE
jgi:hypothetical protein